MTIPPVGAIAIPAVPPITKPSTADNDAAQGGFAAQLGHGLNTLQQTQTKADDLAAQAATGDLLDVHDYMIAATEASLTTQLTVAVRNKAVDAFNEIMRMQA
ncbi:MAG: flagellar hook-basal body complex protein FliE [Mycobacteriales bacterium]|jgi:flagellar hook-basal body complex protein FliE